MDPLLVLRIGILLAAGRGRRMGGNKQFHPWPSGDGTVPLVVAAFDTIRAACDSMIVVLGHRADEVAGLLESRTFLAVLSDPDAPMFESFRSGAHAVQEIDPTASVLLQLGDHPELAPSSLAEIVAAAGDHPDRAILPEVQGRGGHPVLIPAGLVQTLLKTECPGGLRQVWIDHPEFCIRLPVDDSTAVLGINSIEGQG